MKLYLLAFGLLLLGLVCVAQQPRAQLTMQNFGPGSFGVGGGGGGPSCAHSSNYFARSAAGFTSAIDTFFCDTAHGLAQTATSTGCATTLFDCFDVIYDFSQATGCQTTLCTTGDALLNMISTNFNGTVKGGGLTFTANSGYRNSGTSSYIDTGLNPTSSPGLKMATNNYSMFCWIITPAPGSDSGSCLGSNFTGTTSQSIYPHFTSNVMFVNCNNSTGSNHAAVANELFFGCTFDTSNNNTMYQNTTNSLATGSGAPVVPNATLIATADTVSGAQRPTLVIQQFASFGQFLNTTDQAKFCNAVNVLMTSQNGSATVC